MAVCSGCRAPVTGNFCAHCGAPADHADLAPILLDASGPQETTSRDSIRRGSRGRSLLLGVAILAAVCAGGLLLSQTAGDPAEPAAEDDAADITRPAETTQPPQETSASTTTADTVDDALEVESDWFVVVQTNDGIHRADALTGETEDLGLDGSLLGEAWGRVLIRRLSGDLQSIPVEELGGELPIENSTTMDGSMLGSSSRVIAGSFEGFAWIVSDFNGTAWHVDLVTGEIIRTAELDHSGWFGVSPDFRTPMAGGVYALQEDDSYRLVVDGRVLAEGPGRILVNGCDESLSCRSRWIDSVSFEELAQFYVPANGFDGWFPQGIGNGRFLSLNLEAVDSVTGDSIRLENIEMEAVWDRRIAVSPDAQYVAMQVRNGKLRVRSVDGLQKISVDGISSGGWDNTPIFVPRTSG